ncbi:uncharacterized protein LOC123553380 [Mercenaria mercenaria]|uniref:uncharacterized protein LOC123553380 n=1 Tax=Mercenaria mercenaria TaxID=6596 RepID=UPI00234F8A3C|nr:uncharacterized protein LOC123553380 [Mercenaria mercenaria]
MNFTENENTFEKKDYNKIDWFVFKDSCLQVMIRDTSKPYIIVENMHVFYLSVMETQDSFLKINYKTYTDIIDTDGIVEMTSIGEIYSTFTGNELEYAEKFTWVTTKYNFSKIVDVFRCKTSENTLCEQSYNAINQTVYVDGNWEKIFIHNSEGNTVFGSLQSLREKVSNGHRLLLHFRGKLREPDMIIFDKDNITTVFSLYPLKPSDSNQATVLWEMVSTSGKYETVVFDFWTGSVLNETIGTSECSWFVDKAAWTNVLDSESNTTEKLVTAFKSGSSIRIKSNCLHVNENSTSFSCLYGATSVFQSRGSSRIVARANLYPSLTLRNTGLHFSIDAKPVWMALRTSAPDDVKRRLWLHGQSYFENVLMINSPNTTWFAN